MSTNDSHGETAVIRNEEIATASKRPNTDVESTPEIPQKKACSGDTTPTILMGGAEGIKQLEDYLAIKTTQRQASEEYQPLNSHKKPSR